LAATSRVLDAGESAVGRRHAEGALDLASRLPRLVLEARRVAASSAYGVHGRRKAGPGETFWQFRAFSPGEPANRIDWRRSARDDRTFVREREWEAAHTVALWFDRSPSMAYVSTLALAPKIDRALVVGLALGDLLVRAGERVGLLGGGPATASRSIVDRLAQALVEAERAGTPGSGEDDELPPGVPLHPMAETLLLTDGLLPVERMERRIEAISSRGARGHLLLVADPVEETFPFSGHAELFDLEVGARLRVGSAESFRVVYLARLAEHRERLAIACRRRGWSFGVHRTDRPASGAVLSLMTAVQAGRRDQL